MKNPSLRDLRLMAKTPAQQIGIENLVCTSYDGFLRNLDRALDYIASDFSRNPQLLQGASEDQITIQVVRSLKMLGFHATFEMTVGGHCDVVVEWSDTGLWLGEAKKFTGDYTWIYAGFLQLDTRYSTGSHQQTSGGLLIYVYTPHTIEMMQSWGERLKNERQGLVINKCGNDPLAFRSSHKHARTGLTFHVRHKPFSLFFQPQDRKKGANKRQKPTSS